MVLATAVLAESGPRGDFAPRASRQCPGAHKSGSPVNKASTALQTPESIPKEVPKEEAGRLLKKDYKISSYLTGARSKYRYGR
jgi:hypothetical protein